MSAVDAAKKLIAKFGKSVVYSTVAQGAYNPATGAVIETTTPATVQAVITSASKRQAEALGVSSALQLLIAPGVVAPTVGDRVTIDSVSHLVKVVDTVFDRDVAALYTATVVRG